MYTSIPMLKPERMIFDVEELIIPILGIGYSAAGSAVDIVTYFYGSFQKITDCSILHLLLEY